MFEDHTGDAIPVNHKIPEKSKRSDGHICAGTSARKQRIDNDLSGQATVPGDDTRNAMTAFS
jgi:hypothetical protein